MCDKIVQAETALALKVLPRSLRWIPWVMSAVLGYFIFDIAGDQQGAVAALWAPLCMLSIPVLAKLWHDRQSIAAACLRVTKKKKNQDMQQDQDSTSNSATSNVTFGVTADIEMISTNPILLTMEAGNNIRNDASDIESSSNSRSNDSDRQ
jgi:hypothetical protein